MPWSDSPLRSLTLPQDAGPSDARTVIGPDIPAELQTFYTAAGSPVVAAILYYVNATDYFYDANLLSGGGGNSHARGFATAGVVWEFELLHYSALDGLVGRYSSPNAVGMAFGDAIPARLNEQFRLNRSMPLMLIGNTITFEDNDLALTGAVDVAGFQTGTASLFWRQEKLKNADTVRTNQAALFNDPDLVWDVEDGAIYRWEADIIHRTTNVANDVLIGFGLPAGATITWTCLAPGLAVAAASNNTVFLGSSALVAGVGFGAITTDLNYKFSAIIRTAAGFPGQFQYQFAQNPAAAGTSIVCAMDSFGALRRIG